MSLLQVVFVILLWEAGKTIGRVLGDMLLAWVHQDDEPRS